MCAISASPKAEQESRVASSMRRSKSYVTVFALMAPSIPFTMRSAASLHPMWRSIISAESPTKPPGIFPNASPTTFQKLPTHIPNKSKKSNIMASETLARAIMFQWKLKTSKVELEVLVTVFDVFKLFLTKEFQTNPKGLLWCMDVAREENILIIYNMLTHACLHDEMVSLKVRDYLWDHAVATRTLTKEMEGLAHIFLKVHPHKRDHDEEAFTGLHGSTWDVLRSLARRHTEGPGEWWQVTEYFR